MSDQLGRSHVLAQSILHGVRGLLAEEGQGLPARALSRLHSLEASCAELCLSFESLVGLGDFSRDIRIREELTKVFHSVGEIVDLLGDSGLDPPSEGVASGEVPSSAAVSSRERSRSRLGIEYWIRGHTASGGSGSRTLSRLLLESYEAWCRSEGIVSCPPEFFLALSSLGYGAEYDSGTSSWYRLGVVLLDGASPS